MTKHLFNKVMHSVSLRQRPPRAQGRQVKGERHTGVHSGHAPVGKENGPGRGKAEGSPRPSLPSNPRCPLLHLLKILE